MFFQNYFVHLNTFKMKKIIFLAICAFLLTSKTKGQITLEATYDTASVNLYMVNLEVDGDKYIRIQRQDSGQRYIDLYNLDHSLWKRIDCNPLPMFRYYDTFDSTSFPIVTYDVLYVSQHLFDLDDDVEFMFAINLQPDCFTGIYNDDGTAVFTQDSAGPWVRVNVPQTFRPIYNTSAGTKMILSFPLTKQAKVYSLPGTLTTSNMFLAHDPIASTNYFKAYPNPSSGQNTIEYHLPNGIEKGEIIIHDLSGKELKRYKIDNSFSNLILNNSELQGGTYLYSLIAGDKLVETKKVIITQK
jgi:hypothetical protein